MMYVLHFKGGSHDGEHVFAVHPYDEMRINVGRTLHERYVADVTGPDGLEWIDDNTRGITLTFRDYCDPNEPPANG